MFTPLDQVANGNHLQLVKAAISYLPRNNQKLLSILIKMIELQNILHFYDRGNTCVSACDTSAKTPSLLDMLTDIRSYCEGSEQEMLDQWIQIASAMELYSMFAQSGQQGSDLFSMTAGLDPSGMMQDSRMSGPDPSDMMKDSTMAGPDSSISMEENASHTQGDTNI